MDLDCSCSKLYKRACAVRLATLVWNSYITIMLVLLLSSPNDARDLTWKRPGCYRVGHKRLVEIPDCIVFNVTINACRGFCESYAYPSPTHTLQVNNKHILTSRAECCSIKETYDYKVLVECVDGPREVVFKPAKSCSCSICTN